MTNCQKGRLSGERDRAQMEAALSVLTPALEQILQATGFTARIIPEEEGNGGDIRVTGWQGPGGIQAVAEQ
jgi:hypothetical protein